MALLRSSPFFGALSDSVLEAMVKRGHVKRFNKGAVIYARGDVGDNLMVILSGRVKVVNVAPNAREVALNFLGPGDFNGEIAVLDGGPRSADAVALEDTTAFVVYRRDFMPALSAHPEALLEIIQVLCQKLRVASDIVEAYVLEMSARTASGLLRLAQQHGRNTKRGILIDFKIPQRDLGSYLGLSRENVSRQLARFREAGLISMEGAGIYIVDEEGLAGIAAAET